MILFHYIFFNSFMDGDPYRMETTRLICCSNQWTGFYTVETSGLKELMVLFPFFLLIITIFLATIFLQIHFPTRVVNSQNLYGWNCDSILKILSPSKRPSAEYTTSQKIERDSKHCHMQKYYLCFILTLLHLRLKKDFFWSILYFESQTNSVLPRKIFGKGHNLRDIKCV